MDPLPGTLGKNGKSASNGIAPDEDDSVAPSDATGTVFAPGPDAPVPPRGQNPPPAADSRPKTPLSLSRLLGLPYSFIMRQRRALYGKGLLPGYAPSRPCVSIGNIAWGGTGKTPLTAWLLDWAEANGLRAVVLSRGYGGKPGRRPLLVRRDTPVELSGDEPALLARAHAEAAVVVSPRRAEAARFAETRLDPDLFILDDGMQHLGLKRDCDIVLLRPEDLAGQWNRVIPSGSWREGRSALKAASAFAVKLDADAFRALLPEAEARLAEYGKPLFSFTLAPFALRPLFPRRGKLHPPLDPAVYRGKPYLLVSGVGNPAQVEATARAFMGYGPTRHYAFADHHAYAEKDVRRMMRGNTLPVVCTAKDAVKLRYFDALWGDTPVWMLDVRAAFGPGVDFGAAGDPALGFTDWWTAWWRGIRACVETRGLARI